MGQTPVLNPLHDGRRFAEAFTWYVRRVSDANPKPRISARLHVGFVGQLSAFRFTLGQDMPYLQTADQGMVDRLVARAVEAVPTCKPAGGDLAVFVGLDIFVFKRFDEPLTRLSGYRGGRDVCRHLYAEKWKREMCWPAKAEAP